MSAGRPTAAKIRGSVTKLPEGIPPAPTAGHQRGQDDDQLVDRSEVELECLGP